MGSGKSTVARALAKKSGRFYIDSDDLIENLENRSIKEIFEKEGEAYFRSTEKRCLSWMVGALQNCIISTGGGMPIYSDEIGKLGALVFLKCDFETLKSRARQDQKGERPLLNEESTAKRLYEERQERYASLSDLTVDANRDVDAIAEEILQKVPLSD